MATRKVKVSKGPKAKAVRKAKPKAKTVKQQLDPFHGKPKAKAGNKKAKVRKVSVGFTDAQKGEIAGIVAEAMAEHQKASGDLIGERLAKLKAKPKKTMVNFRLEQEVLDALDTWAKGKGISNRTDAIKAMILSAK